MHDNQANSLSCQRRFLIHTEKSLRKMPEAMPRNYGNDDMSRFQFSLYHFLTSISSMAFIEFLYIKARYSLKALSAPASFQVKHPIP